MTFYVDTSVFVSAVADEADSERSRQWLGEQVPGVLAISDWVEAEFSAALSIKVRTGGLSDERQRRALLNFAKVAELSLLRLPVERAHFRAAARFADQSNTGLRAGDALHLAIAAAHGAWIVTMDRRLSAAAEVLGFQARSP